MAKRFGTPGEGGNAGYSEEELRTPYYSPYGFPSRSCSGCSSEGSSRNYSRENKETSKLGKFLGLSAIAIGAIVAGYGTIQGLVYLMNNN